MGLIGMREAAGRAFSITITGGEKLLEPFYCGKRLPQSHSADAVKRKSTRCHQAVKALICSLLEVVERFLRILFLLVLFE